MQTKNCHISTEHMFGTSGCIWYRLELCDIDTLKIPEHLVDQVFRISVCSVPEENLHFLEFIVSGQFPKDSFTYLVAGARRLCGSRILINILNHGSLSTHLVVLTQDASYHLDMDLSHLSSFDRDLLEITRTPNSLRYSLAKGKMAQHNLSGALYKTLSRFLQNTNTGKPVQHRAWVDLLLKLIFLVFIQKKGWLNFDPFYLERMMDRCHQRGLSILHVFFKPLFARLNGSPVAEPLPLGNLPHLGGGLFQFSPENLPLIENRVFLDLHEQVFCGYSFTLFEEKEGVYPMGITPEVLGVVFENLMASGDRRNYGVFFTPSSIARRQVEQTFLSYQKIHEKDEDAIKNIRVFDPSCGSGTYLVTVFQLLLKYRLQQVPGNERYNGRLFALKSEIVRNNLFGMDINPLAVRLTEIRLWLNMIQDLEIGSPDQAPQLPHLQHHIRTGDFLAVPLHWNRNIPSQWSKYSHYLSMKQKFTNCANPSVVLNHLIRLERELSVFHRTFLIAEENRAIREKERQTCLPGFDKVRLDRKKRAKRRDKQNPVNESTDPLGPHLAFCGELMDGGFDMIVGNPPWLSSKAMPAGQKKNVRALLKVFAGFEVKGQMDLSLFFTIMALQFIRKQGQLGFLLPGKLLQAQYAEGFRSYMEHHCQIDYLFDYGIDQNFVFTADTFPLALGVTLRAGEHISEKDHEVQIERHGKNIDEVYSLPQYFFGNHGEAWLIPSLEDLPTIKSSFPWPRLGSRGDVMRRGIVSGNKAKFTFSVKPDDIPTIWLRPLLRGRDLQEYSAEPGAWLLYPFDDSGALIVSGRKRIAQYLRLESEKQMPSVFKFRPIPSLKHGYTLIWRYLDGQMRVWLLKDVCWVPDQTTYYIYMKDRAEALYLFHLLNSPLSGVWSRNLSERGKDRFHFHFIHSMKNLRIPPGKRRKKPFLDWKGPVLFPHQRDSIQWEEL